MSKVKTITATSTEQEITLDATYQFVWFRNLGDNDCYVSDHSGIIAGADDVTLCKTGECVRITLPQAPMSNKAYIKAVDGSNTVEIHAQNFSDKPTAKTGKGSGGGSQIVVEALTVTDNGVYTAPTGKAYSPVTVDVQEQPWQPLEDGYSNFWFELTNDTLSPWLNFSAKTADAVIDWGDGSGEVALDTLTPTHTYSKAGRYVVKVKGVTGIDVQYVTPFTDYCFCLVAVELNSEVTQLVSSAFYLAIKLRNVSAKYVTNVSTAAFGQCVSLNYVELSNSITSYASSLFQFCFSLTDFKISSVVTIINSGMFYYCRMLKTITIPSAITNIDSNAFSYCSSLTEVHVQSTTPPTLGSNVFTSLPPAYVIYVPVGYGDTYKAASGWSTYADHILEEGQTPNRMMLAKFNEETDEPQDDMR